MYHLRLVIDNIASMVENFWTIQILIAGWEQIQTLYKEQLSGQEQILYQLILNPKLTGKNNHKCLYKKINKPYLRGKILKLGNKID